ncbi:mitochondrial fission ELM1 family protein [Hyphococcus formosus]|uniref:mitochondrial fission ELM1 family protein n=1 Tax=Hyphococcus formosus TaxID=3143534 RepID=UPI00398B71BC
MNIADAKIWVLTDGKIGDDVQCLAIAQCLDANFEKRVVSPRLPWSLIAPWGPVDPREQPGNASGPLAGSPPDIAIISGRRAIPHARALKKESNGRTRIVVLKDPRIGRGHADIIWVPAHDRVSGPNIISTLTSPHGLAGKIAASRKSPSPYPTPFLGVVLGGPSGGARYEVEDALDLGARLSDAAEQYGAIVVTPSRRTPPQFIKALREAIAHEQLFFWDGNGDNPYIDILTHADALVIAADSHNMMSEALATGVGVYAWCPRNMASKLTWFIDQLAQRGDVIRFDNSAPPFVRTPIDATPEIAEKIKARISR